MARCKSTVKEIRKVIQSPWASCFSHRTGDNTTLQNFKGINIVYKSIYYAAVSICRKCPGRIFIHYLSILNSILWF